ncbi:MAG: hypothetical protein RLZZ89_800, partial [Cyanobacteriota bacterium]
SLLDLMDEIFNVAKLFELSSIFHCHDFSLLFHDDNGPIA